MTTTTTMSRATAYRLATELRQTYGAYTTPHKDEQGWLVECDLGELGFGLFRSRTEAVEAVQHWIREDVERHRRLSEESYAELKESVAGRV